ncbi:MAG: cytochrome c [Sphingobacteriaceae bacterium]|nr:cytochrome c [Sphingobacteriaceae bacterium]MBK7817892.1 cytochrome c [Sphingobacteriaceae bacterium]
MKHVLLFVSLIVLVQCKTTKSVVTTEPSEKELTVAQKTWPSTTLDELKEGQAIYKNQCTECHKNFTITKFSEKKWKHEIDDMSPKAKLTDIQKEKLSKFILSYREVNAPAAK